MSQQNLFGDGGANPHHDKRATTDYRRRNLDIQTKGDFNSGAKFSCCDVYRYSLWRRPQWSGYERQVMFIGLNPSTADAIVDDPTIRRCRGFMESFGMASMIMCNAYAFRATDPADMLAAEFPVGSYNDQSLADCSRQAALVIAAWGNHITSERQLEVCELIQKPVMCLGKNKNGTPKHPLYLSKETQCERFWTPGEGYA